MLRTVIRTLRVLNTIAASRDWIGVGEDACRTGFKVPTVQHTLRTIQHHGFLESDANSRRYRADLAGVLLSQEVSPHTRLRGLISDSLKAISDACDKGSPSVSEPRSR